MSILLLLLLSGVGGAKPSPGGKYDYSAIDAHALRAPAVAARSVETLAAYLTRPARNEREKVRAIFRWIAENIHYDTERFFSGRFLNLPAENVLAQRRSICDGYSDLFVALAEAAGLKAVKIGGYAKGWRHVPGTVFHGRGNHAWNAVQIEGQWKLVDCTWGAGYVDENGRFVRKLDESQFLTPPEHFIYRHFPHDPAWQLLDPPLAKEEFERWPNVRESFSGLGVKLRSHTQAIIEAGGDLKVTLQAPDDVVLAAQVGPEGKPALPESTLIQRDGECCEVRARFPAPGIYRLTIYGKLKSDAGAYAEGVDYRVKVRAGTPGSPGFPQVYNPFGEHQGYLYSPLENPLKAGSGQDFRLKIADAEEVVVIHNGEWHRLQGKNGIYRGRIRLIKDEVKVSARFPGDQIFSRLLTYSCR